ncbi:MAG: hypothetical protein ACOX6X_05285 [Dethiobacteria bacterium]
MPTNRNLLLILGVILIISLALLSKIGDLSHEIKSLSRNYRALQSEIGSLSGSIDQKLDQFTREQSWITPVQVNEGKTVTGQQRVEAVLNWQIKDLPAGAEVTFHYSDSESGDFKSIVAETKDAGFFEVTVPLVIEVEPYWDISVRKTGDRGITISELTIAEPLIQQTLSYYVSMKVKDNIKCSEISSFDLGYLANVKYDPITGHININDNNYDIILHEHYYSSNSIKSVSAKFYNGNNVISEKVLKIEDRKDGRRDFSLSYNPSPENVSHLQLQVKYQNGKTFTKEFLN